MVNEFPFGTSKSGKRDYLFRISVCPGNFPVGRTKKTFTNLHPNRNFRESAVIGKQSTSLQNGPTAKLTALQYFTSAACVIAMDMKLCLRGTIRSNQTSDCYFKRSVQPERPWKTCLLIRIITLN